jgi:hypothetical protein
MHLHRDVAARLPWFRSLRNMSTPVTVRLLRLADANDLDFLPNLDNTALNPTRYRPRGPEPASNAGQV